MTEVAGASAAQRCPANQAEASPGRLELCGRTRAVNPHEHMICLFKAPLKCMLWPDSGIATDLPAIQIALWRLSPSNQHAALPLPTH